MATPVSVISLETPVRRRFGETFDEAEMERIVSLARREGIRLHLDGARIFLQSAYSGRSVAEYADPFDTVYVSLYKYFNAASGAILAGPRALLDEMYHPRRMFGAGLPGAWPFASVARHYVPGFVDRFGQAVAISEEVVERLSGHEAFAVERISSGTNLFWLQPSHPDLTAFRRQVRERGVELGAPRSDGRGFLVGVNETWNRKTSSELVDLRPVETQDLAPGPDRDVIPPKDAGAMQLTGHQTRAIFDRYPGRLLHDCRRTAARNLVRAGVTRLRGS